MTGIADLALGAAPIAGGALLGSLAGAFKGPDFRAIIKSDIELLDSLPEDSTAVRADLKRTIDERMQELITSIDRNRELRLAAGSYKGNWRDTVLFVCAVMFALRGAGSGWFVLTLDEPGRLAGNSASRGARRRNPALHANAFRRPPRRTVRYR